MDYDGSQYWSDVITIIPHEENSIELDLDLLALNLTNDPGYARYDGVPPVCEPKKIVVSLFRSAFDLLARDAFAETVEDRIYFFIFFS